MYRASSLLFLALLAACSGCAMCTSCDDEAYSGYGGKWQRSDMTYGRVGSAFTETGFDTGTGGELMQGPGTVQGLGSSDQGAVSELGSGSGEQGSVLEQMEQGSGTRNQ